MTTPLAQEHYQPTAFIAGALTLFTLGTLTVVAPPTLAQLPVGLLFCGLLTFSALFGIPLAGGAVSLLPMLTVGGYLIIGPVAAGWTAGCATLLHGALRYHWAAQWEGARRPTKPYLINLTLANMTMQALAILAGSALYRWLGGALPLREATRANWLPLLGLALGYLTVNYTLAGVFLVNWKKIPLRTYLGSLKQMLVYEGLPLIFAPLTALIYNRIGPLQLLLFATILVGASLIARNLDRASQRLERRVQELDSLQAVGQALSASLQVESIVATIYAQVTRLMPTENFYVALYNPEVDEVTFPLAVENGARVQWRSRRAGAGLTEYVLRARTPLLLCDNVAAQVHALGIEHIGTPAACWLGVPILAGEEPLGVIALQSYTEAEVYDLAHQELLRTLASQAAIAIQNARLYARTDAALAHRVQELNSILRTTGEGILLLDMEQRVLTLNRALSEMLGMAQTELLEQRLPAGILDVLGYPPEKWAADCAALHSGARDEIQHTLTLETEKRALACTLTPVRDRAGSINGWLLVFRDITEELELAQLRKDLTAMLVHDLRSPLTVVMGSLALMKRKDSENFEQLRHMAHQNSERILSMVNELLDISKLESGQLNLHRESLNMTTLLQEIAGRFAPLAAEATITLQTDPAPALPELYADAALIKRALGNLIDNAIKFTPDGGQVRVWARCEQKTASCALLMGVSDTGPGIPIEAQSKIFEKFQQAAGIEGRRRGTGLGLAFCKLAIEAHGGRIWVESTPGQGATFTIALPLF